MDAAWRDLIEKKAEVTEDLVSTRRELFGRAEASAAELKGAAAQVEVDVVVAGAGFMALYYLGVEMVLSAAGVKIVRVAGASSGAMMPMELRVLGSERVVDLYLAYGRLQDASPRSFLASAWRADRHWKMWADALFRDEAARLAVDGTVTASVTRLTWRGFANALYSRYPTLELARAVYYATGTGLTWCDGYYCTDGGVTDGAPRFADALRPQLIVRSTRCGLSTDKVARFGEADVAAFIRLGQDDAQAFLRTRLVSPRDPALPFVNDSGSLTIIWPGDEPTTA